MGSRTARACAVQGKFINWELGSEPGQAALQAGSGGDLGEGARRISEQALSLDEPGQALPTPILAKLEAYFGESLSDVRIHEGRQAEALGAVAFAMGSHVFFARGRYEPFTRRGLRLLGHEIAHVLQQRHGALRVPDGDGVFAVHDEALEALAHHHGRMLVDAERDPRRASVPAAAPASSASAPGRSRIIQGNFESDADVLKRNGKLEAPRFSSFFGGYVSVLGPETLRHQLIKEEATGKHYIYDREADKYLSALSRDVPDPVEFLEDVVPQWASIHRAMELEAEQFAALQAAPLQKVERCVIYGSPAARDQEVMIDLACNKTDKGALFAGVPRLAAGDERSGVAVGWRIAEPHRRIQEQLRAHDRAKRGVVVVASHHAYTARIGIHLQYPNPKRCHEPELECILERKLVYEPRKEPAQRAHLVVVRRGGQRDARSLGQKAVPKQAKSLDGERVVRFVREDQGSSSEAGPHRGRATFELSIRGDVCSAWQRLLAIRVQHTRRLSQPAFNFAGRLLDERLGRDPKRGRQPQLSSDAGRDRRLSGARRQYDTPEAFGRVHPGLVRKRQEITYDALLIWPQAPLLRSSGARGEVKQRRSDRERTHLRRAQ